MKLKRKKRDKNGVHLIAYHYPNLPVTEQYRLIRTNIQFSSIDREIKTIMVTSPEPADGKSTTAANLAVVLSQQGKRVLLVDTDLRKPSIHYTFKVSNMEGLTNVLTREISIEDAIDQTYVPNLNILTSGPIPPNPSELLNSDAMETVVKYLYERFDHIVFDTPPILAVTDPQILANKCDGVVMVVCSRKTRKDRALKAKELLEKAQSHLLGVVVNAADTKDGEYFY